jgi:hypothetical protein
VSSPERPRFDPRRIFRLLVEGDVQFVVIGGIAAVLHGSSRDTGDLDVTFGIAPENLEALGKVLQALHARLRGVGDDVPFVPDARTLRNVEVLTLATDAGDLDVLARPSGAEAFEDLARRAERYEVGGVEVLVAALPDLIAMKRAAGRLKDLADVAELEAILRLRQADSA